ncbi:MAG: HyaD/HybD family hydrogenase maturation endopeptidase [Alphaproteobacteria bacterium]|nr:HyaD/HybD family hydrogenase maturation endopeptidase [Alphaproteobacteria bacterium]
MRTLVLGLGNILLSDEGVGVRVVEALAADYRVPDEVEIVDGGTSGMDLMETVAGCDCLIVTDAVNADALPGTVLRFADDAVRAFFQTRLSPHQLGLSDLLAALTLTDEAPRRVILIGVVPADLSLGTELSETVAEARDAAAEMVARELDTLGHEIAPRTGRAAEAA